MNWLKENWFKVGVLIMLFGIVSLLYALAPKQLNEGAQQLDTFDRELKCKEIGSKLHKRLSSEFDKDAIGGDMLPAEYWFSPSRNACFYRSGRSVRV